MLLLHEVNLTDFLSHHKTVIKFAPQQSLLIDGKIGSGKSSICDALVWALYGIARSDNKSLIRRGAKSALVRVILIDDKDKSIEFIIERSITNSGKHEFKVLEKSGKSYVPVKTTGIRGTQEHLENIILRSSYLLFINSIVHLQNNDETFVNQPAVKRKDLILEIIKAADYDEYLKKAKELLQDNNSKAEVSEAKIESAKHLIEEQQEKASRVTEYEAEDVRLKKQAEEAEATYKVLQTKQQELGNKILAFTFKKSELTQIEQTQATHVDKLASLNKRIIELSSINIEELKEKVKVLEEKRQELSVLEKVKDQETQWTMTMAELIRTSPIDRGFDSQIEEINKQIIETIGEPVEKCQKCGTPYPKMEERRQQRLASLEQSLVERQKDKRDLEEAKVAHNSKIGLLGPRPVADNKKINALKLEIKELEEFEKKLAIAENSQKIIDEAVKDIETITLDQTLLQQKKKALEEELTGVDAVKQEEEKSQKTLSEQNEIKQMIIGMQMENRGRLMVAQEATLSVNKSKKEVASLSAELKVINEDKEALNAIKDAFGPNGLRAIVIDYVIPNLEDKINNVLQKLSDFRVRLDTQKSGAGKDVVLEGLFITIINGEGQELDFSNYSGGEKLKIVTAISEALAEIQNIGFRVLDELFIGLDDESISGFTNVMIELQERFSQMICISHLQQIKDIFSDKITVTKINGVSQIV